MKDLGMSEFKYLGQTSRNNENFKTHQLQGYYDKNDAIRIQKQMDFVFTGKKDTCFIRSNPNVNKEFIKSFEEDQAKMLTKNLKNTQAILH